MLDLLVSDVAVEYEHPRVLGVETWKSLLLISTHMGIFLRDIENEHLNYPISSQEAMVGIKIMPRLYVIMSKKLEGGP